MQQWWWSLIIGSVLYSSQEYEYAFYNQVCESLCLESVVQTKAWKKSNEYTIWIIYIGRSDGWFIFILTYISSLFSYCFI